MNHFVPLSDIARISLGYKSLQNDFFYVNKATVATYKLEPRFLRQITLFKGLRGDSYLQNPPPASWLFLCREEEPDLRGTGALRYIHAMSERPAAEKKQSGSPKTIREVLQAQSGGLWYAPKAKPHSANIWLRKAFNTVYAPFIFNKPRVLDQRCNYIQPIHPLSWEILSAVLTSTIFAYGLEINGSASMGAGALEAPTSKLRSYPVFDPRPQSPQDKKALLKLAASVWSAEKPPDWAAEGTQPGPKLRALDEWLLTQTGTNIKADQLYSDLRATCAARIAVAHDKVTTTKKQKIDSVATVARGIAVPIAHILNSRQFPEDFATPSDTIPVHVSRGALRQIKIHSFFDTAELTLTGDGGQVLLEGNYNASVAEAIARAVLLGRQAFQVPAKREAAQACLSAFLTWFRQLRVRLDEAIAESALGTGYEDQLRAQVYQTLRIHPLVGDPILPGLINCAG